MSTTQPNTTKPIPSCKSLTYIIPSPASATPSHVLPVNTLHSTATNHLYTAGRDGVISLYDQQLSSRANHIQLHTDWVNEVVSLPGSSASEEGETVVSCSSDLSVKYWRPHSNEHGLIGHHSDYVKCLTAISSNHVISAGLDRRVNLWDVQRAMKVSSLANEAELDKGSVYSLCSSKVSGITAFGDNDSVISLYDPHQNKLIRKLKGHYHGVVRSLILKDHYLASGGADGVVNLWDIRTNTVLESYDVGASVWCVYSAEELYDFSELYVGDSLGQIHRYYNDTDKQEEKKTEVIGRADKGILSITKYQGEVLSTSMASSDITNHTNKSKCIVGSPGLIKSRLLNNRRHVLTKSTNNELSLWDIISCQRLKTYPQGSDFDNVVEAEQGWEILPSWCRVSVKAGQLFVTLNESSFANVEVYGDDLQDYQDQFTKDSGAPLDEDTRFNLGKFVLCSLFDKLVQFEVDRDKEIRDARIKELKGDGRGKLSILTKFGANGNGIDSAPNSALSTPTEENSFDASNSTGTNEEPTKRKRTLSIFGSRNRTKSIVSSSAPTTTTTTTTSSVSTLSPSTPSKNPPILESTSIPNPTLGAPTTPINSDQRLRTSTASSNASVTSSTDTIAHLLSDLQSKYSSTTTSSIHILQTSVIIPPSPQETPRLATLRPDLFLLVNERTSETSTEIVSYAEELNQAKELELSEILPRWIGDVILKDIIPIKDTPRISFTLTPDLSPGSSGESLPALKGETARLTAYNMLRVRKILWYVTEKLESKVPEVQEMQKKNSQLQVEDWLELCCNGQVISNYWWLSVVRTRVWKKGGDIQFYYRRKQLVKN